MKESPKDLAEASIRCFKEELEYAFTHYACDRTSYRGKQERDMVVHHFLGHCLIHKTNAHQYVEELLKLDLNFLDAIIEMAKSWPEHKLEGGKF